MISLCRDMGLCFSLWACHRELYPWETSFLIVFVCLFVCLFFVFSSFGPRLQHMEVPKLGLELELQLPAYTTATAAATAMPDPSRACDLHHSSRQCWILNPLSRARDRTHVLMDTNHVHYLRATPELPGGTFFKTSVNDGLPQKGLNLHVPHVWVSTRLPWAVLIVWIGTPKLHECRVVISNSRKKKKTHTKKQKNPSCLH